MEFVHSAKTTYTPSFTVVLLCVLVSSTFTVKMSICSWTLTTDLQRHWSVSDWKVSDEIKLIWRLGSTTCTSVRNSVKVTVFPGFSYYWVIMLHTLPWHNSMYAGVCMLVAIFFGWLRFRLCLLCVSSQAVRWYHHRRSQCRIQGCCCSGWFGVSLPAFYSVPLGFHWVELCHPELGFTSEHYLTNELQCIIFLFFCVHKLVPFTLLLAIVAMCFLIMRFFTLICYCLSSFALLRYFCASGLQGWLSSEPQQPLVADIFSHAIHGLQYTSKFCKPVSKAIITLLQKHGLFFLRVLMDAMKIGDRIFDASTAGKM